MFQAYSDVEEGDIVANKIAELRREHSYGYADFAILYRTNAQSRVFEEALRKRSSPIKFMADFHSTSVRRLRTSLLTSAW